MLQRYNYFCKQRAFTPNYNKKWGLGVLLWMFELGNAKKILLIYLLIRNFAKNKEERL